jgi:hypothetical protein
MNSKLAGVRPPIIDPQDRRSGSQPSALVATCRSPILHADRHCARPQFRDSDDPLASNGINAKRSTNWIVRSVSTLATTALTPLRTIPLRYRRHHTLRFPSRGPPSAIIFARLNNDFAISPIANGSSYAEHTQRLQFGKWFRSSSRRRVIVVRLRADHPSAVAVWAVDLCVPHQVCLELHEANLGLDGQPAAGIALRLAATMNAHPL